MNDISWADRLSVKKGALGESIVDEFLRAKRVIPYRPHFDGAHPFDRLCATADKKNVFIADIKTKPSRLYFPDTGIDLKHFHEYRFISSKYGLRIFLFFVDEMKKSVYGNWLTKLVEPKMISHNGRLISYPLEGGRIIYFPLKNMISIAELDLQRVRELMDLSTRNGKYVYEQ